MIEFTVPGQPQGKGRPRIGKAGRMERLGSLLITVMATVAGAELYVPSLVL